VPPLLIDVFRLTAWLVLLTLIFAPLERLFTLSRRQSRRSLTADLGYFYVNGLVPALLIAAPLAFIAAGIRAATPPAWHSLILALPLWASIGLGLVVADLGSYFVHRWCHRSPTLWQFHAIHHTPVDLDWLVNSRAHPIDIVVTRLGGLVPLYLLGLDGSGAKAGMVPVIVTLVGTFWAFLIHANVRWRFGLFEQLIATPAFHHWHHTNDEHRDHNFAATFPLIDRMFGTLHLPGHWPPSYGINEPVNPTLYDEIVRPFTYRWRLRRRASSDEPSPTA
jgi:sterol desaturase/sphingolipid hydroxylase (fatty acid hydroxylase superfamily)